MTSEAIQNQVALIQVGHQLGGHELSDEALDRVQRVLEGETSPEEAREGLRRKYPRPT